VTDSRRLEDDRKMLAVNISVDVRKGKKRTDDPGSISRNALQHPKSVPTRSQQPAVQ
jgi:hypothetical protein